MAAWPTAAFVITFVDALGYGDCEGIKLSRILKNTHDLLFMVFDLSSSVLEEMIRECSCHGQVL